MAVVHPVHGHGHPPPQQIDPYIKVAQLQPQMNGVNIYVIVLDVGQLRRTATGGAIQVMRVADPTGSVNMTIMNPEVADIFQAGDIVKVKNAFTNIHRGGLTLSCGRMGEFVKSGEFFMLYSEVPNLSEYNPEWAAIERARKPSPPEEGEVSSGGPTDPRRPSSGRPGMNSHKRLGSSTLGGPPPSKRPDNAGAPHFRGRP